MPGFSFLTTLIAGLGAWGVRAVPSSVVGGGVVVGLALTGAGATTDFDWLLNVGVLFAAVFLGVALGRIIPPRSRPMFGLLVVLSVADIIWIVSGGGSATGWVDEVFNFSVRMGTSSSTIGTVDLLLASTVATHWAQRRGSVWLAVSAAPIGMIISNIYVAVSGADNLALVPFIALGWLETELRHRRTDRPRQTRTQRHV